MPPARVPPAMSTVSDPAANPFIRRYARDGASVTTPVELDASKAAAARVEPPIDPTLRADQPHPAASPHFPATDQDDPADQIGDARTDEFGHGPDPVGIPPHQSLFNVVSDGPAAARPSGRGVTKR